MTETTEPKPPDAGLPGELITELKVSGRTVAAYPKDHPSVQNALKRTYGVLQNIFRLRPGITLAVGKDTFLVDAHPLDKKNHIYRQFAQQLRRLGIAYLQFSPGITTDELYHFQRFISQQRKDASTEEIHESLTQYDLRHINVGFLDYEAFSFEEGKTASEISQEDLWETYISGIMHGTLKMEEIAEELEEIPFDTFAHILSKLEKYGADKVSAPHIISLYMGKFFQRPFSNRDIRKLLASIKELPSDLQEEFLSVMIKTLSEDILATSKMYRNISPELIMELVETARSKKIDIPENLRNLLDVVLNFDPEAVEQRTIGEHVLVDDIYLPSDAADMVSQIDMTKALSDSFETSVSNEYEEEISQILEYDATDVISISLPEMKREMNDDFIERTFNHVILEIMSSDLISRPEYLQLVENLKEQTAQFIVTGQYGQIVRIKKLLQNNLEKNRFADITSEVLQYYSAPEFFASFIDSLKVMGRQSRDEAWQLCEEYGETMIPILVDALMNEETQSFRSLLMSLIRPYGDAIVPEALPRLNDSRWFVKRNMLYLLSGCKNAQIIPHVRPYCGHENPKVRLEAVKCLLSMGDHFGVERVQEYLRSGVQEDTEQAISLVGAYRITEAVPVLVQMLRGKEIHKSDVSQKVAIIQALGSSGDVRSLDAFREIIFRKTFFFKGEIENLKVEIYKTLKNYPYKDIEDIVEKGLKSKNEVIRNESLRLTKIRKQ